MPFIVGDQVAVLSPMNPLPRVLAGPLTVTGLIINNMYRLNNGNITLGHLLRPWTADTMIGAFIPGFFPQMAPGGQFAVGQQVALRADPTVLETISGGPYLYNGEVVYETRNGYVLRSEVHLMVPGAIPAAPADPYAAIADGMPKPEHMPGADAENILTTDPLNPGDEMVNLKGPTGKWESEFGRFYKKSTFDLIASHFGVPGQPGLKLKKNPAQGNFLFAANVRKYRMPGGRRKSRKTRVSKKRKTHRR